MSGLARFCSVAVALALTAACSTGRAEPPAAVADTPGEAARGTESCTSTAADRPDNDDFLNVVYLDGTSFIASSPTSDAPFGAVVGRVRCTIYGSRTPADYEGQDGDATHVPAGSPLHQVAERAPSAAVGAYLEGKAYTFVREDEYRERSVGRCTVPLTQPCPS